VTTSLVPRDPIILHVLSQQCPLFPSCGNCLIMYSRDCVTRWIFFEGVKHFNQYPPFCVCVLMAFKVFQRLFTTLYSYYLLFASLKLYLLILQMLLNSLRIPFSVIGQCSLVTTSHWLQGKYTRTSLS